MSWRKGWSKMTSGRDVARNTTVQTRSRPGRYCATRNFITINHISKQNGVQFKYKMESSLNSNYNLYYNCNCNYNWVIVLYILIFVFLDSKLEDRRFWTFRSRHSSICSTFLPEFNFDLLFPFKRQLNTFKIRDISLFTATCFGITMPSSGSTCQV